MQTVEETDSWQEQTQPAPAPPRPSSSTVKSLPAGPLVPGPSSGVWLPLVVVVVVVVAAVVPVHGVVVRLGAVGRTGRVQSVRVEGVGRGGGGPRRGAALRLRGASRPADGENVT